MHHSNLTWDLITAAVVGLAVAFTNLVVIFRCLANSKRMLPIMLGASVFAIVIMALNTPWLVVWFRFAELEQLSPDLSSPQLRVLTRISQVFMVGSLVWTGIVALAQASYIRLNQVRLASPKLALVIACVAGVIGALISHAVFEWLSVRDGGGFRVAKTLMPRVDFSSVGFALSVSLPMLVAGAVGEELLFRGIVQTWLTKNAKGAVGVGFGIALCSAFWALAHVGNAEPIAVKLTQIFCLGLILGTFKHRYGLSSSIAMHVCLNASVAVLGIT